METIKAGYFCNDANLVKDEHGNWKVVGDPTEGALIVVAYKAGIKEPGERLDVIPFESEKKLMATLNQHAGKKHNLR